MTTQNGNPIEMESGFGRLTLAEFSRNPNSRSACDAKVVVT